MNLQSVLLTNQRGVLMFYILISRLKMATIGISHSIFLSVLSVNTFQPFVYIFGFSSHIFIITFCSSRKVVSK